MILAGFLTVMLVGASSDVWAQNCTLSPVTGDMVCEGGGQNTEQSPYEVMGKTPPPEQTAPPPNAGPVDGGDNCETVTHTETQPVMILDQQGNQTPLLDRNGEPVMETVTYDEKVCDTVTSDPGFWSRERSLAAICIAEVDNAGAGYCAKGVANILIELGYPVSRGNAYTWASSLPANGWEKHSASTPQECPPGGVLVYDRDDPPGNGGGSEYGHVEIVTETPDRKYVSDAARTVPGGTVPDNFVGCYVYPEPTTPQGNYPQCTDGVE